MFSISGLTLTLSRISKEPPGLSMEIFSSVPSSFRTALAHWDWRQASRTALQTTSHTPESNVVPFSKMCRSIWRTLHMIEGSMTPDPSRWFEETVWRETVYVSESASTCTSMLLSASYLRESLFTVPSGVPQGSPSGSMIMSICPFFEIRWEDAYFDSRSLHSFANCSSPMEVMGSAIWSAWWIASDSLYSRSWKFLTMITIS
mmetsp:Transcript_3129/g.6464  ORF Transcript_3129/g.6464 Transcript_3129/m.6464 type:complete len:203 (-) Transcript_3129:246-854(-)